MSVQHRNDNSNDNDNGNENENENGDTGDGSSGVSWRTLGWVAALAAFVPVMLLVGEATAAAAVKGTGTWEDAYWLGVGVGFCVAFPMSIAMETGVQWVAERLA